MQICKWWGVVAALPLLVACGGGGGDCAALGALGGSCKSDSIVVVVNTAPVAHAGANQSVLTGATVSLDGSASSDAERDSLTFAWTLTSAPSGSAAALSAATSAKPSFVADVPGVYALRLVVSDGQVASSPAVVLVTVSNLNAAPVAVAGSNQSVTTATLVTLDGSASSDANRDALSYAWTLNAKPAGSVAVLSSGSSPKPTFTADVAGTYVASLLVSDGLLTSNVSVVTVTASVVNAAPVAVVGPNQSVLTTAVVTLDGRLSTDANRDVLAYKWSLLSKPTGSTAALSSATAAQPTFTADLAGTYVASLIVNDGKLDSPVVATTVTASAANAAPVANAGTAQTVATAAVVLLDGRNSTDANGDSLTYTWVMLYKPTGSVAALSSATASQPTFTADLAGVYVLSLVVNDGKVDSAVATVSVTATAP